MTQTEEFKQAGRWFFRWRSYLPSLTILLFLIAFKDFTYPKDSRTLEALWEVLCFTVSFLGLGIRIYTIGHTPKGTSDRRTKGQKADVLNTTGIYSIVRHPLYLGNFLIWLGLSFFTHSFFFILSAVLLFILFFERVIFVEEDFLRERFGQAFKDWAGKTPMMIPSFKNRQKSALPFSLKTVLKREHSTFFLIIGALTCMKVFGDFCYTGKWQIGWFYSVLFCFGLVVYSVLIILKKKHLLNVEGR